MTRRDKTQSTWQFAPVDTWFFREAKPIEAATGHAAKSIFPPTPFTLAGAVRGVLKQSVNDAALEVSFEDMHLRGVYVLKNGQRLYPVPASLLMGPEGLATLVPGRYQAVLTDVDTCPLNLPVLSNDQAVGSKPIEGCYLSADHFLKVLCGRPIVSKDVITPAQLFTPEPRVGIAREFGSRAAKEGFLYQVAHLRLQPGVSLQVTATGLNADMTHALAQPGARHLVRLGGEGRMASVQVHAAAEHQAALLPVPPTEHFHDKKGLRIVFTTPVLYRSGGGGPELHGDWMQSKSFQKIVVDGVACWETQLFKGADKSSAAGNAIRLRIKSAAQQRLQIEGTWDFKKPLVKQEGSAGKQTRDEPRSSAAYLPAGTTWFCELIDANGKVVTDAATLHKAAERLHGKQLGGQRLLGRGEMAVGCW